MEWQDTRDEWSDQIEAAHPLNTGAHQHYAMAMDMIHNRKSKGALVELVCWLLQHSDIPAPPPLPKEPA